MSKQKPLEDILVAWSNFKRPENGQIFEHYKGDRYECHNRIYERDRSTLCGLQVIST